MVTFSFNYLYAVIAVFSIGYLAIIFEYSIKVNKTAAALFTAVILWILYFLYGASSTLEGLAELNHYIAEVAQIIFFLLGAMTLVEIIDSHKGFKIVTDLISTSSKKKMLWLISFVAFFLSAILDNLTTTILMVSLLRKLVPSKEERFLPACMVVVAANAGGAWSPIGDVTTTMLWIAERLTSFETIKTVFIPSLVSVIIPLLLFTRGLKGRFKKAEEVHEVKEEYGARLIFILGVGLLVFVPILKALTGLPPFMAMLMALAVVWLVTDCVHHACEYRQHLRIPHILTKIDTSAIMFFVGILLCVGVLQSAGILKSLSNFMDSEIHNYAYIATIIGIASAIVDNVPIIAGTIGMYSLDQIPVDSNFWHLVAYTAGTGGSLLLIGSSSGIALMGMEKIDFFSYMKKISLPTLIGFLAGVVVFLIFDNSLFSLF